MKPHAKNLRIGRHSAANQAYHVILTTLQRKNVFDDFSTARSVIRVLAYANRQEWAKNLCFVVMPDHIHWLFVLGEEKSLQELIRSIKRESSRHIEQLEWQRGFYDHGIRQEEDLKVISRYIINNPLRAGLAESIRDYSHWDAIWL